MLLCQAVGNAVSKLVVVDNNTDSVIILIVEKDAISGTLSGGSVNIACLNVLSAIIIWGLIMSDISAT